MSDTVSLVSLGCAKNRVNSEQMLFRLQQAGYRISAEPDNVDLVIINTCGFIDAAKEEAIGEILEAGEKKKAGTVGRILVTGCLAQRYRDEILTELPEVDGILGNGSFHDIVHAAKQVLSGKKVERFDSIDAPVDESGRILTTPGYYAYLSIAEGCDNRCSYCIIPKLRGRYRSRAPEDVIAEARELAHRGVRELIVVAQDTSRYGMDLTGRHMLPELLRELCRIEGIHWIRLHYLYPEDTTDEIIDVVASEPKIVHYLDIPIQHVNNLVLKKMNRRGTKEELIALIRKLREKIPDLVLRTSLIAGLPYEDQDAFEELCDFLREFRLQRVGTFVFSPEDGTAAAKMDYPPQETAQRRAEIIEELQMEIMQDYAEGLVGQIVEVLCEGYDEDSGLWFGRSYGDSPDVDGTVWFSSERQPEVGGFYPVFIGEAENGDLVGAIVWEEKNDNGK